MNTNYWPCCFKPVKREPGLPGGVTSFQVTAQTQAGICSDDPWLILHKLDSPTKMRYIGALFDACKDDAGARYVVPGSIVEYVAQIGRSADDYGNDAAAAGAA
jgi:galactosylxylosylprotein 3-beta-galactosyltransferase